MLAFPALGPRCSGQGCVRKTLAFLDPRNCEILANAAIVVKRMCEQAYAVYVEPVRHTARHAMTTRKSVP